MFDVGEGTAGRTVERYVGELDKERKGMLLLWQELTGGLHVSESLPLPGPGQCLVGVGLGRHVLIRVGAALRRRGRRRRQVVLERVGSDGGEGRRRVPATALLACTQKIQLRIFPDKNK